MRSMTRWMLAGCMVLAALGAVVAPARADRPENPFAGSWSGTYINADGSLHGTIDLTISNGGLFKGTFHNDVYNFDGTVDGHVNVNVNAGGNLAIIFRIPPLAYNIYSFHGTAVIDGNDNLVLSYQGDFAEGAILKRN